MTRGVVTLVFDDGYERVYAQVLPFLRRYGMRAVFAVPTDTENIERAEGAPAAPFAAWQRACAEQGHEFAAHGMSHSALPTLTDAELEQELRESQKATGAITLVYPGGAYDARVVQATRSLFRAARTVRPGFEPLPSRDHYRLHSFVATRDNFQVWKWNLRVLWAWLTNRWLIECYHNVSLGPDADDEKRHTVPLKALEQHLRFLRRLPIRIATIRDMTHP